MQIESRKLIFIMNFSELGFFKFASRMPQIAQILVSTFKILTVYRLVGVMVRAPASEAEDLGFESCDRIFWVESYQRLKNLHSSGYPARYLAL